MEHVFLDYYSMMVFLKRATSEGCKLSFLDLFEDADCPVAEKGEAMRALASLVQAGYAKREKREDGFVYWCDESTANIIDAVDFDEINDSVKLRLYEQKAKHPYTSAEIERAARLAARTVRVQDSPAMFEQALLEAECAEQEKAKSILDCWRRMPFSSLAGEMEAVAIERVFDFCDSGRVVLLDVVLDALEKIEGMARLGVKRELSALDQKAAQDIVEFVREFVRTHDIPFLEGKLITGLIFHSISHEESERRLLLEIVRREVLQLKAILRTADDKY